MPNPHFLLLFFLLFHTCHPSPSDDFHSLQAFKSSVVDPAKSLSSWDPSSSSSDDPCSGSWLGVTCRGGLVTRLVLEGLGLRGGVQPLTLLPHLTLLSLKNNSFSAPLHLHLHNLSLWAPHLKLLYLSRNRFSGPFPDGILRLRHLRRLDLSENSFQGPIPAAIGALLPSLLTLRVERNSFAGGIPASLGEFVRGLTDLNVSLNRLTGEIPAALSVFPGSSFVGNPGLCGKPLPGSTCQHRAAPVTAAAAEKASTKRKWWLAIALSMAILASLAATAVAVLLIVRRRREGKEAEGGSGTDRGGEEWGKEDDALVFFGGCREFVMEDLMRGSAEMLGRGVVGTTYRVAVEGGGEGGVVVKRVRKGRLRGPHGAEVESLLREIGGWRHPNVVSLLAYYSSEDELLLVFDYIPRGSLHNLLHGNRGPGRTPLDWRERLELVLGAARGLAFLNGESKSKLSHQHLTCSNVLVHEDGSALVSDFALHQLLSRSPPCSGAPSPDAARRSSRRHDVYGFGIVLLEVLTGRADGEGGTDLPSWVQKVAREEWTSELFDIELLRSKGSEEEDEMFALLQVALLCLAPEAKHRPEMSVVYKMIEDVKARGSRRGGRRRSSSPSSSLNDNLYESSPCLSEDSASNLH